jgi:hypothetical protein
VIGVLLGLQFRTGNIISPVLDAVTTALVDGTAIGLVRSDVQPRRIASGAARRRLSLIKCGRNSGPGAQIRLRTKPCGRLALEATTARSIVRPTLVEGSLRDSLDYTTHTLLAERSSVSEFPLAERRHQIASIEAGRPTCLGFRDQRFLLRDDDGIPAGQGFSPSDFDLSIGQSFTGYEPCVVSSYQVCGCSQ